MKLNDVFKSIDRYLDSDKHTSKIIDIPSNDLVFSIKAKYDVSGNKVLWAHEFCNNDELPNYAKIFNYVTTHKENIFLFGISTYLKLQGKEKLVETFKKIIDLNPAGKLVVISVQCGSLFKRSLTDRRLFDSYRVLMVDSHDNIEKGSLEFVSSKLSANIESGSNGLDHIDKAFECGGDNHLIVRTCHQKAEYPQSLIDIHEVACSYDLLTLA